MNDVVVLKGNTKFNKGLVMPKEGTYLELTQDEMEYVDGGHPLEIIGLSANIISEICSIILVVDKYKRFLSTNWRLTLRCIAFGCALLGSFSILKCIQRGVIQGAVHAILNIMHVGTSNALYIIQEIYG